VKESIDANSQLNTVLNSISGQEYGLSWGLGREVTPARGLIKLLPDPSIKFSPEEVLSFNVTRARPSSVSLLGEDAHPDITLLGSSYSAAWTRFPGALRYFLQRDILAISVEAIQGSWVGMESYLRDDSFQTNKPKLLIWEMPERDMRMPPNYKYRSIRYHSDNEEWLLRAAAWVEGNCRVSPIVGTIVQGGVVGEVGETVTAKLTAESDYFEIDFDRPLSKLDYLSANISLTASNKVTLEAFGVGEEKRKFEVPIVGDATSHHLRVPLPAKGEGFTKVRIYPGRGGAFKFGDLQVCRQPEDLLN